MVRFWVYRYYEFKIRGRKVYNIKIPSDVLLNYFVQPDYTKSTLVEEGENVNNNLYQMVEKLISDGIISV